MRRELGRSGWNLAAADVPQVALILATCEKSLRCSSLLDDPQNYTSALPRRPIHSQALTLSRATAASSRSQEQLRSQHVTHWSEHMGNAILRASTHLRDRAAALAPANMQSVDWVGACVPLAPPDVWPGVPALRDTVGAASRERCGARPRSRATVGARAIRRNDLHLRVSWWASSGRRAQVRVSIGSQQRWRQSSGGIGLWRRRRREPACLTRVA